MPGALKTLVRLRADDSFLSQVGIRHATAGDRKQIFEVLLAAFGPYRWVMPGPAFAAYVGDLFDAGADGSAGAFVVATRGDRILGVAVYDPNGVDRNPAWPHRWASLRAVAVLPEARRMGIGQMLLSACAGYARARGAAVLCLHVPEFTIPVMGLSERLGLDRAPHLDFDLAVDAELEARPGRAARAYVLPLE
jgi:GNAT superfamily N-acetyltransferase